MSWETRPVTELARSEPLLTSPQTAGRERGTAVPRIRLLQLRFPALLEQQPARREDHWCFPAQPAIYFTNAGQKALGGPVTCNKGHSDYLLLGTAPFKAERVFS